MGFKQFHVAVSGISSASTITEHSDFGRIYAIKWQGITLAANASLYLLEPSGVEGPNSNQIINIWKTATGTNLVLPRFLAVNSGTAALTPNSGLAWEYPVGGPLLIGGSGLGSPNEFKATIYYED